MASATLSKARLPLAKGASDDLRYIQPDGFSPQTAASQIQSQEIAAYIAQLTGELSQMAGSAKLDTLADLLAMARVEADMLARD